MDIHHYCSHHVPMISPCFPSFSITIHHFQSLFVKILSTDNCLPWGKSGSFFSWTSNGYISSRSTLDGYKLILTSLLAWEYRTVHQQRIWSMFCRLSGWLAMISFGRIFRSHGSMALNYQLFWLVNMRQNMRRWPDPAHTHAQISEENGAGICTPTKKPKIPKSPSFVGFDIPAAWFANLGWVLESLGCVASEEMLTPLLKQMEALKFGRPVPGRIWGQVSKDGDTMGVMEKSPVVTRGLNTRNVYPLVNLQKTMENHYV